MWGAKKVWSKKARKEDLRLFLGKKNGEKMKKINIYVGKAATRTVVLGIFLTTLCLGAIGHMIISDMDRGCVGVDVYYGEMLEYIFCSLAVTAVGGMLFDITELDIERRR